MEPTIKIADSQGSFILGPGEQVFINTWDHGATFPLDVEVDGVRKFTLYDARPLQFPFTQLKVTGARANSQWLTIVAQAGENIGQALTSPKNIRLFDVELAPPIAATLYEMPSPDPGGPKVFWDVSRGSGFLFVAHTGEDPSASAGHVRYFAELLMTPDDKHPSEVIPMGDSNSHASSGQARYGHIQIGAGAQDLASGSRRQESRRWPGYVRFYMQNDGGVSVPMAQAARVQAWILL